MREVCYCLILILRFGDLLSLSVLQLLDLICGSRSLWFVCNLHLVFVNLWFFGFVFVRESYLGVFGIWVCESASTSIYIIPNLS